MEQVGRRSWMDPSSAKAAPAQAPEPKLKPKLKPAPSMAEMAEKRAAADEQKTEQLMEQVSNYLVEHEDEGSASAAEPAPKPESKAPAPEPEPEPEPEQPSMSQIAAKQRRAMAASQRPNTTPSPRSRRSLLPQKSKHGPGEYQQLGGGWLEVRRGTQPPYWWNEHSNAKQWTEPTATQLQARTPPKPPSTPRTPRNRPPWNRTPPDPHSEEPRWGTSHETPRLPSVERKGTPPKPPSSAPSRVQSQGLSSFALQAFAGGSPPTTPHDPRESWNKLRERVLPDTDIKQRVYGQTVFKQNATAKQKQRARAQRMAQVMAALHQEEQRVIFQRRLERATYHQIFKMIDDDGDGCIQASEILKMMNKLDKEIDSDLFWGTFNKLDTDHSAKLEYPEFVEAMETLARTHKAGTVSDLSSTPQTPPTTRSTNDGSEPDEAGEEQREVQKVHMELLMAGKEHVPVLPRQLSAGEQKPELPEKPPLIRVRRATPKKKKRQEKKATPVGTEFMESTLEVWRGLVGVRSAFRKLQDKSVRQNIKELPFDSRWRTKRGREEIAAEELRRQNQGSPDLFEDDADPLLQLARDDVLNRFASMFMTR